MIHKLKPNHEMTHLLFIQKGKAKRERMKFCVYIYMCCVYTHTNNNKYTMALGLKNYCVK
jgi:hypothetical protein